MDSLYSQIGNLPFFESGKGQKLLLSQDNYIKLAVKNSSSIVRFPEFDSFPNILLHCEKYNDLNYKFIRNQVLKRILHSSKYSKEPEFIEYTNTALLCVLATMSYCIYAIEYNRFIMGISNRIMPMFITCPRITDRELWVSVGAANAEEARYFVGNWRSVARKATILCERYGITVRYKEVGDCINFVIFLGSITDVYQPLVEARIEDRLNPRPPVEFNFDDPLEGLEYAY